MMGSRAIHHGASWNLKHSTIITCAMPSWEYVIPYIITSQDSTNTRRGLGKKGTEFGQHLILKESQKVYVNGKCSAEYVKSALVPYVMKVRIDREIKEQEAVLLMNNCPNQITHDVMNFVASVWLWVLTFESHTTQIFQPLDLTIFGIFKREGKYHLPFDVASIYWSWRFRATYDIINIYNKRVALVIQ
jgi:hypothetical protein